MLPPEAPFVPLALVFPQQTRRVSTWFFGSGAQLITASNGGLPGALSSGRALDQALLNRPAGPPSGGGVGGTLVRRLSGRLKAELSLEISDTALDFSPQMGRQIAATKKSFEEFFGTVTDLVGEDSSSNAKVLVSHGGAGLEVRSSAGVRIMITETPQRAFYFASGGGLASSLSAHRALRLTGEYQFHSRNRVGGGLNAYDETDTVDLRAIGNRQRPFGFVGAGLERRV